MGTGSIQGRLLSIYIVFLLLTTGLAFLNYGLDEGGVDAAVIIVDINGGGNYTTIQDAIDNSSAGDTILVWAGSYYENLFVNKSISLIGNGTLNTTIDGGGGGDVLNISADWVTVSGLRIINSGPSSEDAGIEIFSCENITIDECNSSHNFLGIEVVSSTQGINVQNCTITNNYQGIHVRNGSDAAVHHNDIFHNTNSSLYNDNTNTSMIVNATYNWWGHLRGPYDPSKDISTGGWYNPFGLGDNVTDLVNYFPWLTAPSNNTLNNPPVIFGYDNDTALVNIFYNNTYTSMDPDGDSIVWGLDSNASWLSLGILDNSTLNHIWGVPLVGDVGTFWVYLWVDDGNGGTDSRNFTITVHGIVNNPPTISGVDYTNAYVDQFYSHDYNASDPDGDNLTWEIQTNATWLNLGITGQSNWNFIWGTPSLTDLGSFTVLIWVNDGIGGNASRNFTLTVSLYSNSPPTLIGVDVTSVYVSQVYNSSYNATDPDNDTIKWTLSTNASWLGLGIPDPSPWNYIIGTPSLIDVGTYWANIKVDDSNGGIDSRNITITVHPLPNGDPTIFGIDVPTATVNILYNNSYNATDPELDPITWSLNTNAPWLALGILGISSWNYLYGTPMLTDVGSFWANILVSDGNGGHDSRNITINVDAPVNNPPSLIGVDVTDTTAELVYNNSYNVSDLDGDSISWDFNTNATWLHLGILGSSNWNYLYGIPTRTDVGSYWAHIWINDGKGGIDSRNFTLTVLKPANSAPSIYGLDTTTATVSSLYNISYTAADPDNDPLTWSLDTDAPWELHDNCSARCEPSTSDIWYRYHSRACR